MLRINLGKLGIPFDTASLDGSVRGHSDSFLAHQISKTWLPFLAGVTGCPNSKLVDLAVFIETIATLGPTGWTFQFLPVFPRLCTQPSDSSGCWWHSVRKAAPSGITKSQSEWRKSESPQRPNEHILETGGKVIIANLVLMPKVDHPHSYPTSGIPLAGSSDRKKWCPLCSILRLP